MNPTEFVRFFEEGMEADEGFYAFRNHIQANEKDFRAIIFKLGLIARQLEFLLNNLEIPDDAQFQALKRIEEWLVGLDVLHASYDEEKMLDNALWSIFGGWSMIDGYRGYDPIEKAIDGI